MNHIDTQTVLERARELQRLDTAAAALRCAPAVDWRGPLAALLAAALSLIPTVSAAHMIF